MAITITQLAAISGSTSNTNSYAGTAGTPAAGDLLLAFVVASDTTAVATMTGAWTWKLFTSFTYNAGVDTIYVFYSYATAATSTTPTFDCTGDNATGACIYCLRFTGSYGVKVPVIRQKATNTGNTANPSVTMPYAVLTTNAVIGIASNLTNSAAQWTQPSGWTENAEVSYNTPPHSFHISSRTSGETGTTISWTNANTTNWGVMVLELVINPQYSSIGGGAAYNSPMIY
jgi:hypothetical protein